MSLTRADLETLDAADPLAQVPRPVLRARGRDLSRRQFAGTPAQGARSARLDDLVRDEWGRDLITQLERPRLDRRAACGSAARWRGSSGPRQDEVVVADSTSVNLFKLLAGALSLRPGRTTILSEPGNFPTDLYVMQGLVGLLGDGRG